MQRATRSLAAGVVIAAMFWGSLSEAALFSFPRALKFQIEHINFIAPALAPLGHVRFCLRYRDECQVQEIDFRRRNLALTRERWNELTTVNRQVNRDIIPEPNAGGILTEEWRVAPPAGDCHDYAVTKRHELLARGWPSRALLLSEVITGSGEHHLVLLVRLKDIDLVLDNLQADIRPVSSTSYRWVRTESPRNPLYWSTVSVPARPHGAMLPERS